MESLLCFVYKIMLLVGVPESKNVEFGLVKGMYYWHLHFLYFLNKTNLSSNKRMNMKIAGLQAFGEKHFLHTPLRYPEHARLNGPPSWAG